MDSGDTDALELRVQDPFHRLLLHGVCEVCSPNITISFWIWKDLIHVEVWSYTNF